MTRSIPINMEEIITNNDNCYFIASSINGQYGIVKESLLPDASAILCRFVYDYIRNGIGQCLLIKNGKVGLYDLDRETLVFEPSADPEKGFNASSYNEELFSVTSWLNPRIVYGEGLVAYKEKIGQSWGFNHYKYGFKDYNGNVVIELEDGWRIESGFYNGVAMIYSKNYKEEIRRTIDHRGNIVSERRTKINLDYPSYSDSDLDNLTNQAYEGEVPIDYYE